MWYSYLTFIFWQTHDLCYLFGRASSAVSVCPPAYYADLVCERGRNYLYKIYAPDNVDIVKKVIFDRSTMEWDWKSGVHKKFADSMWYI